MSRFRRRVRNYDEYFMQSSAIRWSAGVVAGRGQTQFKVWGSIEVLMKAYEVVVAVLFLSRLFARFPLPQRRVRDSHEIIPTDELKNPGKVLFVHFFFVSLHQIHWEIVLSCISPPLLSLYECPLSYKLYELSRENVSSFDLLPPEGDKNNYTFNAVFKNDLSQETSSL
jgi:hypothetical protein